MDLRKIALGVFVSVGIVVSGIAFTGGADITSIRNHVTSIVEDLTNAKEDVATLQGAYEGMKESYDKALNYSGNQVLTLTEQRNSLIDQVATLEAEIAASNADTESSRLEIQNEIDRLQSELTKANDMVAALEVEIEAMALESSYERIDTSSYEVSAVVPSHYVKTKAVPISSVAMTKNAVNSTYVSLPATVNRVQEIFAELGYYINITSVDAKQDSISYFTVYRISKESDDISTLIPLASHLQEITKNLKTITVLEFQYEGTSLSTPLYTTYRAN